MQHHEDTIEAYVGRVMQLPATVGVVVVGSVARGDERPDSDVDAYLIVTDEAWQDARARHDLSHVDADVATYDGGYVDVKLATTDSLRRAAVAGDEPLRASFLDTRVVATRDPELPDLVAAIPHLDDAEFEARARSWFAQAQLHGRYFLPHGLAHDDPILAHHAATHLALAVGRALLAHNRVLFQGQKYLQSTVGDLAERPEDIVEQLRSLVTAPSTDSAHAVLDALGEFRDWGMTPGEILSRFVEDNELAWLTGVTPPEYR